MSTNQYEARFRTYLTHGNVRPHIITKMFSYFFVALFNLLVEYRSGGIIVQRQLSCRAFLVIYNRRDFTEPQRTILAHISSTKKSSGGIPVGRTNNKVPSLGTN